MNKAEKEGAIAKYGACLEAIDTLRCIRGIDCDKLTKAVVIQMIEDAERLCRGSHDEKD